MPKSGIAEQPPIANATANRDAFPRYVFTQGLPDSANAVFIDEFHF
jgi:hypothetical protein